MIGQFDALILAGSRGPQDPIANLAGVSHKALAPISGRAMLAWVIAAVQSVPDLHRLFVCIDDAALLDNDPELRSARDSGKIGFIPPGPSPAASVALALEKIGAERPLLITTADHPLLTGEMIAYFMDHAPADADLAVGMAEAASIQSAYPGNRRTYYRLGGTGYSGCNLFLARNAQAREVAERWRRVESRRKNPLALAVAVTGLVGIFALLRFALGILSLEGAFARISRLGARVRPVVMPYAEAAIDVDKPADYTLVAEILKRRLAGG